jgi:hypothetical protein
MKPQKNEYIETSHGNTTRILDATDTQIKFKYSPHWDSREVWINIDCVKFNEENDRWELTKNPIYF